MMSEEAEYTAVISAVSREEENDMYTCLISSQTETRMIILSTLDSALFFYPFGK